MSAQAARPSVSPADARDTIAAHEPPARPSRIEMPRWVQLVLLPLLLLLVWAVAGAVRHVLFLFLVALLIALLLNPLVRGLGRAGSRAGRRLRSSISPLRRSSHSRSSLSPRWSCSRREARLTGWTPTLRSMSGHPPHTGAEQDLARFQGWLDRNHLSRVHVQQQGAEVPQPGRDEGRPEVHVEGAELGRGRRRRGR